MADHRCGSVVRLFSTHRTGSAARSVNAQMDSAPSTSEPEPEPPSSPSRWRGAQRVQQHVSAITTVSGSGQDEAGRQEKSRGLIARAFGGESDLLGLAAMGGKKARKLKETERDPGRFSRSLLADHEEGMPLPGMLIAVLTLFDIDGTNELSEQEWLEGNEALELSTSRKEFQQLRRSTPGNDDTTNPDELNFSKTMGIYGSRKPVEGYIEDVLRRLMKAIISLNGRFKRIQEVLDRTVLVEEISRKNKISRVVRQWAHAHTSKAFDGWRELTRHTVALRVRAGRSWRQSLAATAWRRWAEMVAESREQREAAGRVLGRWRHRLSGAAFELWRDEVREAIDERSAKLGRALGLMRHRSLVLTFEAWAALLARQRDVRELGRRAMLRMVHRLLAATFWAWQETAASDAANRRGLLKRCAARLSRGVAVRCFLAWRDAASESSAGRETAYRRAAARFVNRVAAEVFETWCSFVEWKQRTLRRAAHALGPGRSLYLSWRSWAAHAREAKAEAQREWFLSHVGDSLNGVIAVAVRAALAGGHGVADGVADDLARLKERVFGAEERVERERQHKISRVVRQWRHAHTSKAFDGWRELTRHTVALRVRAGRHWRHAFIASVWRRWVEMAAEVRHQREAAARVLGRWRHRAAASCFLRWVDLARDAVARRNEKLARVVGRMRSRVLSLVWEGWRSVVERSRRVAGMQHRALLRMTHGLVCDVLWAWAACAAEEKQRRHQLLARTAGRLRHRVAAQCFAAWHDLATSRSSGREQVYTRALHKLRNRQTVLVFETWCSFVEWRRRILRRAGHILGPARSMYLAWRTWVANARDMGRAEERRWVLSLLGDSKTWLLEALGEVLPSMLPDSSALYGSLQGELEQMKSQTARLTEREEEHDARLAEQAELTQRTQESQASVAAKLHQQVDEVRAQPPLHPLLHPL